MDVLERHQLSKLKKTYKRMGDYAEIMPEEDSEPEIVEIKKTKIPAKGVVSYQKVLKEIN